MVAGEGGQAPGLGKISELGTFKEVTTDAPTAATAMKKRPSKKISKKN